MLKSDVSDPAGFGASAAKRFLPRNRTWWVVAALACIVFMLFTPKTPGSDCIQIIRVFDKAEIVLNCDSRLLAKLYRDGEKYFTEFNNWKGRPVFFLYGFFAAPMMQAVAVPVWTSMGGFVESDRKLSHYRKYFSLHLAHYALNIGVVLFSIWLALNLLGIDRASLLAVALSAAIASTDLVHGTVWLAHTNIFNLLAAIATAFYFAIGFQHRLFRRLTLLVWASAGGLMVLVYPLFIVLLPALATGFALDMLVNRKHAFSPDSIINLVLAAVLFVLPVTLWNLMVKHVFGTPIYMTAQYGQFVWLFDAYRNGQLSGALLGHWQSFVETLQIHFRWFEVVIPIAGVGALLTFGDRSRFRLTDPVLIAVIVAILGILSFNFLQGYYAARMQLSVVALLFIFVARVSLLVGGQRIACATLFAVATAQLIHSALNYSESAA